MSTLLKEIELAEDCVSQALARLLDLKQEYLKSKGWDIREPAGARLTSVAYLCVYSKDGHVCICEDHAMEIEAELK